MDGGWASPGKEPGEQLTTCQARHPLSARLLESWLTTRRAWLTTYFSPRVFGSPGHFMFGIRRYQELNTSTSSHKGVRFMEVVGVPERHIHSLED